MAEFINSEIKYIKPEGDTGITLPSPIATVKFDVRSPGIYKVEVRQDGSWIAIRDYLSKVGKVAEDGKTL